MKKYLFIPMLIVAALFGNGCKKENGGPFKKDPCKDKICLNGGYCEDGTCVCPQGYTGTDCSAQVTPSKISVTNIEVTKFNQNGDPDDALPDIYVKLKDGSTVLLKASNAYTNAISPGSYVYTPVTPVELNAFTSYTMELWDYDAISDDLLQSITFASYSSTGGFPTTIVKDDGVFAFTLTVTYTW